MHIWRLLTSYSDVGLNVVEFQIMEAFLGLGFFFSPLDNEI